MKKYMFIIPSLSKGGAEKVVSILSNQLVEDKRKVIIITHFKTENEYKLNNNVKVICLSNLYENEYRKKISIFYLIKLLYKLRKNIEKEKPDYILPFLWTTCIRTDLSLMFSKYKKNVIQTVRNNPKVFPKNKLLKKYRDFLIKKSTMTIVQNAEQKQYFKEKLQEKIKILPNPVSKDVSDIQHQENGYINIIGVGRLEEQKNFELLIRAFSEVYKKDKNVRLKIYGEGSKRYELQNIIEQLNISSVAKLCGRSNDYLEIYGDATIYVLSSEFEGMPNTLLEAMATGLPCISTDCPTGPRDIIINNENGILINRNNIQELANAILLVISDTDLKNKISKNARETIKNNYSVSLITKKLIQNCEGIEENDK